MALRPESNISLSPLESDQDVTTLIMVLYGMFLAGHERVSYSGAADRCQIFNYERYFDSRAINPRIKPEHQTGRVADDQEVQLAKSMANSWSDVFTREYRHAKERGLVGMEIHGRRPFLFLTKEGLAQARGYMRAASLNQFAQRVQKYEKQPKGTYGQPWDLARDMIYRGHVVYQVDKEHPELTLIRQMLSLVGRYLTPARLDVLVNDKVIDYVLRRIDDIGESCYAPFPDEHYQVFVVRAGEENLCPIELSGRVVDVRQEGNRWVLHFEGKGGVRIYTYQSFYKIADPKFLQGSILNVKGFPYRNCSAEVCVALKIVERLPPEVASA